VSSVDKSPDLFSKAAKIFYKKKDIFGIPVVIFGYKKQKQRFVILRLEDFLRGDYAKNKS
jgi:hypothetical protein